MSEKGKVKERGMVVAFAAVWWSLSSAVKICASTLPIYYGVHWSIWGLFMGMAVASTIRTLVRLLSNAVKDD